MRGQQAPPQQPTRVRTPRENENEVLGVIEQMLGASRVRVRCMDGKLRMGRIPGKLKRKIWVREDDVVIVTPWEVQSDEKCDVIWRYTKGQVDWLNKKGYLDFMR
ncbi:translation initiation factor eIF-1A [Methanococcus maripaludis]|uniref:Translation initiation factor 1A n=3 Tax=Methanococcus maripaludis TaxID=39152 RepID=IF1A_METM6|nr:translation initiation factor eIF-1A [Methanococcus maripaludis]A6VJQ7.1 RecName: Full=Translation initiation factor 1A; Short=aIF-1A [Methanococcus maripaludis C7]A9A6C2.1 RecName: Full=Translation initiation factor 1A; Short=aIF-1A [Methanococcus maripaludis C6]MBA2862784.1 translation initiation factor 1A [Methanococcus maripaludis]